MIIIVIDNKVNTKDKRKYKMQLEIYRKKNKKIILAQVLTTQV